MAYYSTPDEMYRMRAEKYKHEADRQWALAKNGDGDYHYGKAKDCYRQASENQAKAAAARAAGATWHKK